MAAQRVMWGAGISAWCPRMYPAEARGMWPAL